MSDAGRRLLWHMGGDSTGNGLTGMYMCNGCERPYLVGPDPRVYLVELGVVLGRSKVSHSERIGFCVWHTPRCSRHWGKVSAMVGKGSGE